MSAKKLNDSPKGLARSFGFCERNKSAFPKCPDKSNVCINDCLNV